MSKNKNVIVRVYDQKNKLVDTVTLRPTKNAIPLKKRLEKKFKKYNDHQLQVFTPQTIFQGVITDGSYVSKKHYPNPTSRPKPQFVRPQQQPPQVPVFTPQTALMITQKFYPHLFVKSTPTEPTPKKTSEDEPEELSEDEKSEIGPLPELDLKIFKDKIEDIEKDDDDGWDFKDSEDTDDKSEEDDTTKGVEESKEDDSKKGGAWDFTETEVESDKSDEEAWDYTDTVVEDDYDTLKTLTVSDSIVSTSEEK